MDKCKIFGCGRCVYIHIGQRIVWYPIDDTRNDFINVHKNKVATINSDEYMNSRVAPGINFTLRRLDGFTMRLTVWHGTNVVAEFKMYEYNAVEIATDENGAVDMCSMSTLLMESPKV